MHTLHMPPPPNTSPTLHAKPSRTLFKGRSVPPPQRLRQRMQAAGIAAFLQFDGDRGMELEQGCLGVG